MDSSTRKIVPLTENEINKLRSYRELGYKIFKHYLCLEPIEIEPKDFDQLYKKWADDKKEKKPTGPQIYYGLGSALGFYIVEKMGFTWCLVTDQFGEEYATVHLPTGWETYPIAFVLKRVEDGELEGGFFKALIKTLNSGINQKN